MVASVSNKKQFFMADKDIDIEKMVSAIVSGVAASVELCGKEVLTFDEASSYTGLSKSTLYKMTCNREIPHYKPRGGRVFFNRKELEAWLQRIRVSTAEEVKGGRKGGEQIIKH